MHSHALSKHEEEARNMKTQVGTICLRDRSCKLCRAEDHVLVVVLLNSCTSVGHPQILEALPLQDLEVGLVSRTKFCMALVRVRVHSVKVLLCMPYAQLSMECECFAGEPLCAAVQRHASLPVNMREFLQVAVS